MENLSLEWGYKVKPESMRLSIQKKSLLKCLIIKSIL